MSGRRGDRGAAAMTTVLACLVTAAAVTVLTVLVAALAQAAARGAAAADAAALAAVAGSPLAGGDGDPDLAAATAAAAANGAVLVELDPDGWPLSVQATVEVPVGPRLLARVVPHLSARSAAALRPPSSSAGRAATITAVDG